LDWLNKAIIVTLQDGKEAVSEIQSDLENRVYHDQEGDKGSFSGGQHMDSKVLWRKKKHQINTYLKTLYLPLLILMNFTFWPGLRQS
jgi:hypothetical protein